MVLIIKWANINIILILQQCANGRTQIIAKQIQSSIALSEETLEEILFKRNKADLKVEIYG